MKLSVTEIQSWGFGEKVACAIDEALPNAPEKIKANPYVLMEVEGISFLRADKVARNYFSIDLNDERRQRALIQKLLLDNRNLGHTFLPTTILEREMKKQLMTNVKALQAAIEHGELILEENRIYAKRLWTAETECASYLRARIPTEVDSIVTKRNYYDLDEYQQQAVNLAPARYLLVITGGPGTGKTHTVKRICDVLQGPVALCAPTGKAAKRLMELTGREAKTIHRCLELRMEAGATIRTKS